MKKHTFHQILPHLTHIKNDTSPTKPRKTWYQYFCPNYNSQILYSVGNLTLTHDQRMMRSSPAHFLQQLSTLYCCFFLSVMDCCRSTRLLLRVSYVLRRVGFVYCWALWKMGWGALLSINEDRWHPTHVKTAPEEVHTEVRVGPKLEQRYTDIGSHGWAGSTWRGAKWIRWTSNFVVWFSSIRHPSGFA